jgi:hypothetical protein
MFALMQGTPLFGDEFRTQWEFYSILSQQALSGFVPVLQSALMFNRPVPQEMPEQMRQSYKTGLSEDAKKFAADLITWFTQIRDAGQDAFIMWW